MQPKIRNKIALICWFATAAALIVVFADNRPSPPAAQASVAPSSTVQASQAVPAAGSAFCRPVVEQIVRIAHDENSQPDLSDTQALTAIDSCVKRQELIDTRKCPADFRTAVSRFIVAEWSLTRDAHRDGFSDPQVVRRAFFDVYNHRSPYDSLDRMSDRMKRDIDLYQSAMFDLIETAASYGVD